jgi:hypothetical protein
LARKKAAIGSSGASTFSGLFTFGVFSPFSETMTMKSAGLLRQPFACCLESVVAAFLCLGVISSDIDPGEPE